MKYGMMNIVRNQQKMSSCAVGGEIKHMSLYLKK